MDALRRIQECFQQSTDPAFSFTTSSIALPSHSEGSNCQMPCLNPPDEGCSYPSPVASTPGYVTSGHPPQPSHQTNQDFSNGLNTAFTTPVLLPPMGYSPHYFPSPSQGPYLSIVEEPTLRTRFRYQSEKGSHGGLMGDLSTQQRKTYPKVKLFNYSGNHANVCIQASLYTAEDEPRRHVHKLTGKMCDKNGVCTVPLHDDFTASFLSVGIQFESKKDVPTVLFHRKLEECKKKGGELLISEQEERDRLQADAEKEAKEMNLNAVKICFAAYEISDNNERRLICPPVYSRAIANQKATDAGELKICRMDRYTGSCMGNDEVFLLCEKVNKKDIKVRFFERESDWEAFGSFQETDVHHQVAIVFRTPAYRTTDIQEPVQVYVQLYRPKDQEKSEPKPFKYIPADQDFESFEVKRKRLTPPPGYGGLGSSPGHCEGSFGPGAGGSGMGGGNGQAPKLSNYTGMGGSPSYGTYRTQASPSTSSSSTNDDDEFQEFMNMLGLSSGESSSVPSSIEQSPSSVDLSSSQPSPSPSSESSVLAPSSSPQASHGSIQPVHQTPYTLTLTIPQPSQMDTTVWTFPSSAAPPHGPLSMLDIPSVQPNLSYQFLRTPSPPPAGSTTMLQPLNISTPPLETLLSTPVFPPQSPLLNAADTFTVGSISDRDPLLSSGHDWNESDNFVVPNLRFSFDLQSDGPADHNASSVRDLKSTFKSAIDKFATLTVSMQENFPSSVEKMTELLRLMSLEISNKAPLPESSNTQANRSPSGGETGREDLSEGPQTRQQEDNRSTNVSDVKSEPVGEKHPVLKVSHDPATPMSKRDVDKTLQQLANNLAQCLRMFVMKGDVSHILSPFRHLIPIPDEKGNNCLHLAVIHQSQNIAFMEHLLNVLSVKKSCIVNLTNNLGQTPLHVATFIGESRMVKTLLAAGANPNALDRHGNTPLHLAASRGHTDCLKYLLSMKSYSQCIKKHSPKLDLLNFQGLSPLHLATNSGHVEVINLLYKAGCDINIQNGTCGKTPLHLALESHPEIVPVFLEKPTLDVDAQDYSGNTALHLACAGDQEDVILQLKHAGANLWIENFDRSSSSDDTGYGEPGKVPLDYANDREKIMMLLLEDRPREASSSSPPSSSIAPTIPDTAKNIAITSSSSSSYVTEEDIIRCEGASGYDPAAKESERKTDSGYISHEIRMLQAETMDKLAALLDPPETSWEMLGMFLGVDDDVLKGVGTVSDSPTKYILEQFEKLSGGSTEEVLSALEAAGLHQARDLLLQELEN